MSPTKYRWPKGSVIWIVDKTDKVEGVVRRKVDDLKSNKIKFIKRAAKYIESLADETEKEENYDELPEFCDEVEQALEKAVEYLREEEGKL